MVPASLTNDAAFPACVRSFYHSTFDPHAAGWRPRVGDEILRSVDRANRALGAVGLHPALTPQGLAFALDMDQRNAGAQLHRLRSAGLISEGSPLVATEEGRKRLERMKPRTLRIDQIAGRVPEWSRGRADSAQERRITPTVVWALIVDVTPLLSRISIWAAHDEASAPYTCLRGSDGEGASLSFPYLLGPRTSAAQVVGDVLNASVCHHDIEKAQRAGIIRCIEGLLESMNTHEGEVFSATVAAGSGNTWAQEEERGHRVRLLACRSKDQSLLPDIVHETPFPGWTAT